MLTQVYTYTWKSTFLIEVYSIKVECHLGLFTRLIPTIPTYGVHWALVWHLDGINK